ncbi:hypothetical protein [Anthocerotibacter panamensis]|uniref:hypothetical protein n=1 Tax=Anthocerotibacter panamensis TaxID=2857077 RepID=UPI001C4038AE|nr:hypothetical protein [Anthocerotibacter panamensis]
MPTVEKTVHCACEHCKCTVAPGQGFLKDNLLYCCEACAAHDHDHPGTCCIEHACC